MKQRIIAHLDLDAFFAAVEERDRPRLKGLPIVIGSDPREGKGRGVVSTANYKAREYGIHSALPISKAWQFSQQAKRQGKPEAVFLSGSYWKYSESSDKVMEIVRKFSPISQQASIDEIYIDLTGFGNFSKAREICNGIKKEIWRKEKLTSSIGLATNKLLAKIASDMEKPDGLTVVSEKRKEKFLEPLSIRKIPGIGPKTEQNLNKLGIHIVRDLRKFSVEEMDEMMGKWGKALYYKARGIDNSPVIEEYERKSIGEQNTFFKDTLDFSFVATEIGSICQDVFRRFKRSDFRSFRTVVITVRFQDFVTRNRSHTLLKPAGTLKAMKAESLKLLMPFFDKRENPKRKMIRLVGVRIEKLG
ncbi:DNA polymerase IV [Patescibacteria group bacterium]